MAQTNGLLNRHRGSTSIEGSNPSLSASILRQVCKYLLFLLAQTNPPSGGLNRHSGSTSIKGSPKGTSLSASILRQVCKYLLFLLAQTNPPTGGLNRHRGQPLSRVLPKGPPSPQIIEQWAVAPCFYL